MNYNDGKAQIGLVLCCHSIQTRNGGRKGTFRNREPLDVSGKLSAEILKRDLSASSL